jgi:hypothetical protein
MTTKNNHISGFRFLLGSSGALIIVLAGALPDGASSYTLRATPGEIIFKAAQHEIARFPYRNDEVFGHLSRLSMIDAVECPESGYFPGEITNVLYVETLRGAA